MPFQTIWNKNGICWRFYGNVTLDEVKKAKAELFGDARFDKTEYFILDMKAVARLAMGPEDAAHPAATDKGASFSKAAMKGALVADDSHIRSVLNAYISTSRALGNPWELRLFGNPEEAANWASA